MKNLTSFIFVGLILFLTSCGPSFTDYQEFKNAAETEQFEAINAVLESRDIDPDNKFIPEYINLMLTTPHTYRQLEVQIPESDFDDFLNQAVPIIYHSYSYNNLVEASQSMEESTKKFMKNAIPYQYDYGEQTFRAFIAEEIENHEDYIFRYELINGKHPDQAWKQENIEYKNNLAHLIAWKAKFTYADFKRLNTFDQSAVLRKSWWGSLMLNKNMNQKSIDLLDKFQREWQSHGNQYLNTKKFQKLSDDSSIDIVAQYAIDGIGDRYNY